MRVAGTVSSQTGCQMPVVRGYQMECGLSCQSCFPRGLARSCGSSSARTTISSVPDRAASVTSAANGVYPPSCGTDDVPVRPDGRVVVDGPEVEDQPLAARGRGDGRPAGGTSRRGRSRCP